MKSKLAERLAIVLGVSTALSLGVVACGDAVSLEADTKQGLTMEDAGGADAADAPTSLQPADGGSCAEYTPQDYVAPDTQSGAGGCRAATGPRSAGGEAGVSPFVYADESSAKLEANRLHIVCKSDGHVVMDAVVDCYQGKGEYVIPPGALMLAGEHSDRPCTLIAMGVEGTVRGGVACDWDDPSSLFGSSMPIVGLGTFDIPITP